MKRLIFLFPVLALFSSVLGQKDDPAGAYFHFSLAKIYHLSGEYSNSLKEFEKALALAPSSSEIRVYYAEALWKSGEIRKAIEICQKAAELEPTNPDPWLLLGQIYFHLKSQESMSAKALEAFQKALEIDPDNSEALSSAGQILFANKEYRKAAETFSRLRKAGDGGIQVNYFEAQALAELGELPAAIAVLEEELADGAANPGFVELLGELYERNGQTENAIDTYLEGSRRSGDPRLSQRLAQLLIENGRNDEAIPILREVVAVYPQETQLQVDLGRALRDEKQYSEAIDLFEKVIKQSPYHVEANYELARTLAEIGERERATEKFEFLLGITDAKPVRKVFKTHLALLYQESERVPEAIALFQEVLKEDPEDVDAGLRLFYAYKQANLTSDCSSLSSSLLKHHPDNPYAIVARAQSLGMAGKPEDGASFIEERITGSSDPELLYAATSQLWLSEKEYARAQEVIEKALVALPESERLRFQLGAILERQKQFDAAEAEFKRILGVNPENAETLNYLGYMLADRDVRVEEAVEYLLKAVELEPTNGAYLDSLGWAYYRLNQFDKAEQHLSRAAQLNSADAVILEHLGDLYLKLGQRERALEFFRRSLGLAAEEEDLTRVRRKFDELSNSLSRRQ